MNQATPKGAPLIDRTAIWCERIARIGERLGDSRGLVVEGKLTRMVGLTLEAVGCRAAVGGRCDVINNSGERVETEVVGFAGESLYLMATGDIRGLEPDARVAPTGRMSESPVGDALLGRIIDGSGKPLDGRGPMHARETWPLNGEAINPLARDPIRRPLDVGIRAINALLSVGRGQRLGLFAGSGVGKSVLLGMMTKYTDADVVVVGLIGEGIRRQYPGTGRSGAVGGGGRAGRPAAVATVARRHAGNQYRGILSQRRA